jgi:hypothetical protein
MPTLGYVEALPMERAMTSHCIRVTSLRHLQPSAIASLLNKGLVYDTGKKRWCRKCRTFEIVLALTPNGKRLAREDALNEVQKPLTSSFGLFDVGRRYLNSGSPSGGSGSAGTHIRPLRRSRSRSG